MSGTVVLVCGRMSAAPGATEVDDLCDHPAAAAAALRSADADRVVLGLCERRPSTDLVAALRRAGAAPFGIEAVALFGRRSDEAARLLAGARAKLDALPPGERGRPALNGGAVSRRALFSPGGVVTQTPLAALDETACAGTVRCSLCVASCPEDAIAATTPVPTIDPGSCTACGLCVPRCPQGALRLSGSSTAQIEAQLEELIGGVTGVVLACREADADAPPGWAIVELPTLALLSPGWILQLRARGAEVRTAPCGDARCAASAAAAEELASLLPVAVARAPERIHLAEPRATAEVAAGLDPAAVIESEASPLGVVSLDATLCTLCGACGAACPTGALAFGVGTDETTLRLRPAECVACGRCATACPEGAIRVGRGLDLARLHRDSVELAWAPAESCSACGAALPPRPMRRRMRELLPELSGAPLELCARCASRAAAVVAQDY